MAPSLEHPEWRVLVDGVAERHGARLSAVRLTRRSCVFTFVHGASSVEFVLTARDDKAPALARTPSFNLHYRAASGPDREALSALIRGASEAIALRDRGGKLLDRRKGLIGAEALRRRAQEASR
jgi:hypothetical protein